MNLRWKIAQAAEIRWWKNYLKGKDKKSYLEWKKNYWRDLLIKSQLTVENNASCLDAGCGPAGIFSILNQQHVVAIDPLLDAYNADLSQFNPSDYPQVNFIRTSIEQYQSTTQFDYIFCLNAINHVSNLAACWDKLFAVAKKGSRMLVSIDAHNFSIFKYLFRCLPGDILHPHQYDLNEYQQMVTQRGGQILHCYKHKAGFFFDYYVMHISID